MSTEEFLRHVWPTTGQYCTATLANGEMKQKFCSTVEEAARIVIANDAQGIETYFACASFGALNKRTAANAYMTRSLWLDLDVGPRKAYATQEIAWRALIEFCKEIGLPRPTLVSSGSGLHVYWVFDNDLPAHEWQPLGDALKRACKQLGLHADPTRTADLASILRPVGTHNRKGDPLPVKLKYQSSPVDVQVLFDILDPWAEEIDETNEDDLGPVPAHLVGASAPDMHAVEAFAPADAYAIANACAVIGQFADPDGDRIPEPLWRGMLGVVIKCEDGEELAHEWSAHDGRYRYDETQKKIDSVSKAGPTTCEKLGEYTDHCDACPHQGKIKSPITLGRVVQTTLPATIPSPSTDLPKTVLQISHGLGSFTAMPRIMEAAEAAREFRRFPFIFSRGWAVVDIDGTLRFVTKKELQEILGGRWVRVHQAEGEDKNVPAHNFLVPNRLEYDDMKFAPEGVQDRQGARVLNSWSGFALTPKRGSSRRILRHLYKVICRRDWAAFKYLVRWLAHAVQRPGTPPGVVLILVSETEGTGKSTVGAIMLRIFGKHGAELNSSDQLLGRFNAPLESASFIVINEAAFVGDKGAQDKFKERITADTLLIEQKFQNAYRVKNQAHYMVTSNHRHVVTAGNSARRYFILDVDGARARDRQYFTELYAEINSGGVEAFFDFLMRIDIKNFTPAADMPITDALREQQELSAPIEVRWALDVVADPVPWGITFNTPNTFSSLHQSLQRYVKEHRGLPVTAKAFGAWLTRIGVAQTKSRNSRQRIMPDAATFEAAVRKVAGIL